MATHPSYPPALSSLRAHVDRVIRRLERTSFRDTRERAILASELERALGPLPASRGTRGRNAKLLTREASAAAARVRFSLAQLRSLESTGDGSWSDTLGRLMEEIETLLATEEDRLDPVVVSGEEGEKDAA